MNRAGLVAIAVGATACGRLHFPEQVRDAAPDAPVDGGVRDGRADADAPSDATPPPGDRGSDGAQDAPADRDAELPDADATFDATPDSDATPDADADAATDADAEPSDADAGSVLEIVIDSDAFNVNVLTLAGSPSGPVTVRVTIAAGVVVGSLDPAAPALSTGDFASGSSLTIVNHGSIIGAGGAGGGGGNGGSGGSGSFPDCGRPGGDGGDAIDLRIDATIESDGSIFGGGGGGGGASGCNNAAGGGGGAGAQGGRGGAGATSLSGAEELAYCGQDNGFRVGNAGMDGSATAGQGGVFDFDDHAGHGGEYGMPGGQPVGCVYGVFNMVPGGAPGHAIRRNGHATSIPDGAYATGSGPLRGPVD